MRVFFVYYLCMKYKFVNDYSEGCHPAVLQALQLSNDVQQAGYGEDTFSSHAANLIKKACSNPNIDVHFVSGGTQANLLVITAMLKSFESVIAAESGHINTHEAGAVEATGHKIEYIPAQDGKLTPELIAPVLKKFPKYHTVKPRLVYISNSTELGTIYTHSELKKLYAYCQNNDLLLFIDGARMAMALTAPDNDLSLEELSHACDAFYFGGTKCGALMGEAVVMVNDLFKEEFKYHLKQRGAMLAKGRAIGVQFEALFSDGLIFKLAEHSNRMAARMVDALRNVGFEFLTPPQTNQLFPVLPDSLIASLQEKYDFLVWEQVDGGYSVVRLVTSWATPESIVDEWIIDLKNMLKQG